VFVATGDQVVKRRAAEFYPLDEGQPGATLVILAADDLPPGDQKAVDALELDSPERLHDQIIQVRAELARRFQLEHLVAHSGVMRRVLRQIQVVSQGANRVVVVGPRGSGRERVARTIAELQAQGSAEPTIPLDCSLLDAELLQTTVEALLSRSAELAEENLARLLLLEVDQLPADAQIVMARLLEVDAFDLHVLATARRNPLDLSAQDRFSTDLANALCTFVIEVPPLEDRLEDIPLLAQAAIESVNAEGGAQKRGLSEEATNVLVNHPWRRNVAELFELVAEAHRRSEGPLIGPMDLPEQFRLTADADRHPIRPDESIELDQYLTQIECELIRRALDTSKGNKAGAARRLGISRGRLLRRIEALQLDD
jgi:DNA-binding NtrC family response regulator